MITAKEALELTTKVNDRKIKAGIEKVRRRLEKAIRKAASRGEKFCDVHIFWKSSIPVYEEAAKELKELGFDASVNDLFYNSLSIYWGKNTW